MRNLYLIIYYIFARHLPVSYSYLGKILHVRRLRSFLCKKIFKEAGDNINIEKGAFFGRGGDLVIGDNSGIGENCVVPSNIIIGKHVMMGPNLYILQQNHCFDDVNIPMCYQGYRRGYRTIIEDDVWIGRDVLMTPGRIIKKGSIIGAGTVLTKDFPKYSIIGGNPSRLLKSRK